MKIGILTHYGVNNQGAQLQMYALYRQLEKLGHEPVILTYNKNFDFAREQKRRNEISIKSVPYILKNFLFKKGIRLTLHNVKKYLFNKKFREKCFRFEYYSESDCDAVVVGSDQVFDIHVGINIMMYGFGMKTKQVMTYAPSFAQTTVSDLKNRNCDALVATGINNMKHLSVRDKHSFCVTEELCGRNVPIVCDPALLYSFKEELQGTPAKPVSKKYLIAYSYDRRFIAPDEVAAIKEFARKHGLITVSAGTYHKWCDKNIACNCLEWVNYFKEAEFIITDTFHGTIASIIAQRPFAVLIRETNYNKMSDLLRITCASDRQIKKLEWNELENKFSEKMNWDKINQSVKKIRAFSLNFLQGALEDMENS